MKTILAYAVLATSISVGTSAQPFTEVDGGFEPANKGAVRWADYDSDGDLDILVLGLNSTSRKTASLYENQGAGVFVNSGVELDGVSGHAKADWGDYDNDGDLDLLVSGNAKFSLGDVSQLWRNDGSGSFSLVDAGLPPDPVNVEWCDLGNDGDLDVIIAPTWQRVAFQDFYIFENDAGLFSEMVAYDAERWDRWGPTSCIDFDQDGRHEILQSGVLWEGDTREVDAGGFWQIAYWDPPSIGDFDNDGDSDLIVPTAHAASGWDVAGIDVIPNENGAVGPALSEIRVREVIASSLADFDNDGDLDLLLNASKPDPSATRTTELYRNDNGSLVFTGDSLGFLWDMFVDWGDYDGDGDLDLAMSGNRDSDVYTRLYRNDAQIGNAQPATPSGLQAEIVEFDWAPGIPGVRLEWEAGSDDITPSAALTYSVRVGADPGGVDVVSPHSIVGGPLDGRRLLPRSGNAGHNRFYLLTGLDPGATYYWSVQSIDHGYEGSMFAPEQSFTTVPVGVEELPSRESLVVSTYPNPFADRITITVAEASSDELTVDLFDVYGRRVLNVAVENGVSTWLERELDLSSLAAGVYFARAATSEQAVTAMITKVD